MDQATKHSANDGEDMHPPNSPKLGPRGWLLPPSLDHWKDVLRRECEMTRVQSGNKAYAACLTSSIRVASLLSALELLIRLETGHRCK